MRGSVSTITIVLLVLVSIAAASALFVYLTGVQNRVVSAGESKMISLNTPPKLISLVCFDGYGYMKLALTQGQDSISGKVLYYVEDDTGKTLRTGYLNVTLSDRGTVYIPYLFNKDDRYRVTLAGKNWQVSEYCTAVNDPHMVLYLPLDEGSGTTAKDSSYYENDGTVNGATWTSGYAGKALSFDGTNDYVSTSSITSPSGNASFTFSFWMKYYPQSNRIWIMDFGNRTSPAYTTVHFLINTNGNTQFGFWNGITNTFNISSYQNRWVFITTTYDASSKNLKTYLDGILNDTDSVTGSVNLQPNTFYLGFPWGGESYFNGTLDEVRIYSRALSSEEIKALYEAYTG